MTKVKPRKRSLKGDFYFNTFDVDRDKKYRNINNDYKRCNLLSFQGHCVLKKFLSSYSKKHVLENHKELRPEHKATKNPFAHNEYLQFDI